MWLMEIIHSHCSLFLLAPLGESDEDGEKGERMHFCPIGMFSESEKFSTVAVVEGTKAKKRFLIFDTYNLLS